LAYLARLTRLRSRWNCTRLPIHPLLGGSFMAKFIANTPINTNNATIAVDVTAADALPLGANRFQLVVVDDPGNESAPTILDVIVRDAAKPTAVLDIVDSAGRRIDPAVSLGQSFTLSGARSADLPPGKIVQYRFTLLPRL
jgi:hypothetical protein